MGGAVYDWFWFWPVCDFYAGESRWQTFMTLTSEQLALTQSIIRALTFVTLYVMTGFGPGFILGLLLGNRLGGRGKPAYFETHNKNIAKAFEHNKQWMPDQERWRK